MLPKSISGEGETKPRAEKNPQLAGKEGNGNGTLVDGSLQNAGHVGELC